MISQEIQTGLITCMCQSTDENLVRLAVVPPQTQSGEGAPSLPVLSIIFIIALLNDRCVWNVTSPSFESVDHSKLAVKLLPCKMGQ